MVTLFGRWNKRLLLAKVLVGTNRYGAVNHLNYKQFLVVCTVLLFLYLVSSSPVKHVSCVCMHQGFDNCLFRAVWSKPVWEISAWGVAMVDVFSVVALESGNEFRRGC